MFFPCTFPDATYLLECPGSSHGRGRKKSALKIVIGLWKQLHLHWFFNLIRGAATDVSIYAKFFSLKIWDSGIAFLPPEIFWRSRRSLRFVGDPGADLKRFLKPGACPDQDLLTFCKILEGFSFQNLPKISPRRILKGFRAGRQSKCFVFINNHWFLCFFIKPPGFSAKTWFFCTFWHE